jgi:hypothetical protein
MAYAKGRLNERFNGSLTVHHSVDLNLSQLNAQFYLLNNNNITS